jgi:large subunit ribosomal protein L35
MPKKKTNKSAAKRFKLTGAGHLKRSRAFKQHILTKKSRNRKRSMRRNALVHKNQEKTLRSILNT